MPRSFSSSRECSGGSIVDAFYDFILPNENKDVVRIMGIVNVTPDSFSDGGDFYDADKAVRHGLDLLADGADILDIGGESTRPGAQPVGIEEEISRVVPVIEGLKDHAPWISIDTRHAAVMEAALGAGANIINDVSALSHDPESLTVAARANVPVILMHMQGAPENMQDNPNYNNVVPDIVSYLQARIEVCESAGIDKRALVIDPGIGFGKSLLDNLSILRYLNDFSALGCQILLGTSRKSFIGHAAGEDDPKKRLGGSIASALYGVQNGVKILRTHDVYDTKQAVQIRQAISDAGFL